MKKKIVKPLPQKEVKKKSNEVMAWILAVMMILWTVASVLGVIGFARTCENEEESGGIVRASAETAVDNSTADTLSSSVVLNLPATVAIDLPFLTGISIPAQFDETPYFVSGNFSLHFEERDSFFVYNSFDGVNDVYYPFSLADISTDPFNFGQFSCVFNYMYDDGLGYDGYFVRDLCYLGYDDIDNFYSVYNGYVPKSYVLSYRWYSTNIGSGASLRTVYCYSFNIAFSWFDINDNFVGNTNLTVEFVSRYSTIGTQNFIMPYFSVVAPWRAEGGMWRSLGTYDVPQADSILHALRVPTQSYSEGYANGSAIGYNQGYDVGYDKGSKDGYNKGFQNGEDVGFEDGYNEGFNDANTYTFHNLLGAVFDVPVQTFLSITNFEILGVNLGGFLLALLTILMILAVLKLIF